jgi:hypothetical protein
VRLHLVDGTYELFRSHFSKRPPRTGPDGADVKATYGVVSSLLQLLDDAEESPTHLAVAFDNPIESFRNRLFYGYKDSSGVDPDRNMALPAGTIELRSVEGRRRYAPQRGIVRPDLETVRLVPSRSGVVPKAGGFGVPPIGLCLVIEACHGCLPVFSAAVHRRRLMRVRAAALGNGKIYWLQGDL